MANTYLEDYIAEHEEEWKEQERLSEQRASQWLEETEKMEMAGEKGKLIKVKIPNGISDYAPN